jgi:hypothetical protein
LPTTGIWNIRNQFSKTASEGYQWTSSGRSEVNFPYLTQSTELNSFFILANILVHATNAQNHFVRCLEN